jgi:hypothetical protein
VISSTSFSFGIQYWEFLLLNVKNPVKIGVTTDKNIDLSTAFCDHPSGFGFFTIGQLRNGSDSMGVVYSEKMTNNGKIGIVLNCNKGQVVYIVNGKNAGPAF